MEVTNLNELKQLMKGEASNKFEFEEDPDVEGGFMKGMEYDPHMSNSISMKNRQSTTLTFVNNTYRQSHGYAGGDDSQAQLDSEDSEIAEQNMHDLMGEDSIYDDKIKVYL